MKSRNEIRKAATAVSSNPARRRTQMKIRMMLMTFISASCLSAMSTKDAPPSDYGVPTNSVVATPVGYEKRMTLDTGETVRMYPDKLSPEEYAKCRVALFASLARIHYAVSILFAATGSSKTMTLLNTGAGAILMAY